MALTASLMPARVASSALAQFRKVCVRQRTSTSPLRTSDVRKEGTGRNRATGERRQSPHFGHRKGGDRVATVIRVKIGSGRIDCELERIAPGRYGAIGHRPVDRSKRSVRSDGVRDHAWVRKIVQIEKFAVRADH